MTRPLHIVGNVIRSFVLIGLLFAIFFGLVFAGAWLTEGARVAFKADQALITERALVTMRWLRPYMVAATGIWVVVALVFSGYVIHWTSGCRVVAPGTQPRLEGILKRLCQKAQMEVPMLGIIESQELNAFATGLFKRDYLVAVTEGLAARLDDAEIEAVVAHELAHIRNRDVLLAVMAGTVAGGIAMLAQLLYFGLSRTICLALGMAGRDDEEGSATVGWMALALGFVLVAFASFVTTLIGFALSRSREYLADAGAAEMTGNPRALITALEKICDDCDIGAPAGVMQMCIDRPRPLLGLFSTHPRPEDRIAALRDMPQKVSERRGPARPATVTTAAGLHVRAGFGQRAR